MSLRDHRNQAKQWSYGRAQLMPERPAHWNKGRTKRLTKRVKAATKDTKGANDHDEADDHRGER